MPKGPRDPDHEPFEFRPGVGGFPTFGGMRKTGNPGSTPPNMFHHLKNVRIVGDEVVSRLGQTACGDLDDPVIGLHVILEDETDAGDVLLGTSVMTCAQTFTGGGMKTLAFEKAVQLVSVNTFDWPIIDLDGVAYSMVPVETGPGTAVTTGNGVTRIQKVDAYGQHGAALTTIEIHRDAVDVIKTQLFAAGLNKLWIVVGSATDAAFTKVWSFAPGSDTLELEDSPSTIVNATFDHAFGIAFNQEMFLFFRTDTGAGDYLIRKRAQDGSWTTISNPSGFDFLAFPRPAAVYKNKLYLFQGKVESGTDLFINEWDGTDFDTVANTIPMGGAGDPANNVGGASIGVHDGVLFFLWAGYPLISVTLGTGYIGKFDGTTWTDNITSPWGGSVGVVPNGLIFSYAGRVWVSIANITNFGDLKYSTNGSSWTSATSTPTGAFFRYAIPKRT